MNIRKLREQLRMTQVDLAIKCEVSLASLRMWEKGVTKPKPENLAKLKTALEVE
jgi:DNA-binding transcriptional regulator YiaG